MDKNRIDTIISESIDKVLNEDFFGEKKKEHHSDSGVGDLINNYFHKHKKKNKDNEPKRKVRKKKGGGKEYYDYADYELKNKKISQGDASSVSSSIDTEKTNIAAVARDLFPDHTEEGAQSQLRKIINGDRPMSKKLASRIEKMISAGQIAVK
jgi:hypothetical protein